MLAIDDEVDSCSDLTAIGLLGEKGELGVKDFQ